MNAPGRDGDGEGRGAGGIAPGAPWGRPAGERAATTPPTPVHGGDPALAAAVDRYPVGTRLQFLPDADSDLARALGLTPEHRSPGTTELHLDVLRVAGQPVVNLAVLGHPPDATFGWHRRRRCVVEIDGRQRFAGAATGVVVANGQHRRGLDLVPRGHPGDGRLEVHVYTLAPGQRRAMRRRLPSGTHVPHPGIQTFSGRTVRVRWSRRQPLELDGCPQEPVAELEASLEPGRLLLVV